jgi:8-oxo-dGTP pyrophosphatase MutT (NUDIX family)
VGGWEERLALSKGVGRVCLWPTGGVIFIVVDKKLKEILSRRTKKRITDDRLVPSAVLLPIYYKEGEIHILFTRRTENVREHKRQISFPGGAHQGSESLLQTALRESSEEIGLAPDKVKILGELDDMPTTSHYNISPFVGLIPWPYDFKLDGIETDEIIEAPLPALLDEESWHHKTEVIAGREVIAYYYHYRGDIIWGATARILHQFLELFVQAVKD